MDFDLSEEQRLLKDSVDRLVADRYGFEQRKKYIAAELGFSRELWSQYAEIGLLGMPFPEEYGGFGGGGVETAIVMEAFGRRLVIEPYLATVLLGGALVLAAGTAEQKQSILPRIADGSMLLAFAHHERQARYDLADVGVSAAEHRGEWRINGEKSLVLHGDVADKLIVSGRISGNRRDRGGIGLFLVDGSAHGLTRRTYRMQDSMGAAEIRFDAAPATPLGTPAGTHFAIVQRVIDRAIAALCAEAVGAMEALHTLTVDYLKTRKQFGRPIGDFQVLQHRAVDMFTALEQARSMALFAAVMADSDDAEERSRSIGAAKIQIGRSGRHVGQEGIQLHGGIAMTMEYAAGHYLKRLTVIDKTFGDADWHLSRLAAAGGLFGEAA